MKKKSGVTLVSLAVAIIVSVIILGMTIGGIENVLVDVAKEDFVIELSTIKEKVKEYYILMGKLPVKQGVSYTSDTVLSELLDASHRELLREEIQLNKDAQNSFLVIDLKLLQIETSTRGLSNGNTDIYVVATNSLNIYYLKGEVLQGIRRFSTVNLVEDTTINDVSAKPESMEELSDELQVIKSTGVWTNDISLLVKNTLKADEALTYSVAGVTIKDVPESKTIVINLENITEAEKSALETNKYVIINKLQGGSVIKTKQIAIENLDVVSPTIGELQYVNTSNSGYNIIKINSQDAGGSGIKAVYYDYNTVLISNQIVQYYDNRSAFSANELIKFGSITNSGEIRLDKNIKSIMAVAVDNAGNISEVKTYNLDSGYLISK